MRAIIVGDKRSTRELISKLVLRHGFECGPEDIHSNSFLACRPREGNFHLAVIHATAPGAEILPMLRQIRGQASDARIVVVGPADDSKFILTLLRQQEGWSIWALMEDLPMRLHLGLREVIHLNMSFQMAGEGWILLK